MLSLPKGVIHLITSELTPYDALQYRATCNRLNRYVKSHNRYWFKRFFTYEYSFLTDQQKLDKKLLSHVFANYFSCLGENLDETIEMPYCACYNIKSSSIDQMMKKHPDYNVWKSQAKKYVNIRKTKDFYYYPDHLKPIDNKKTDIMFYSEVKNPWTGSNKCITIQDFIRSYCRTQYLAKCHEIKCIDICHYMEKPPTDKLIMTQYQIKINYIKAYLICKYRAHKEKFMHSKCYKNSKKYVNASGKKRCNFSTLIDTGIQRVENEMQELQKRKEQLLIFQNNTVFENKRLISATGRCY